MLRVSAVRKAVMVAAHEAPIVPTLATTAMTPAALFFADRAVKSTHTHPSFLCTRNALVSGCERGNAAVALRQVHAPGLTVLPQRARQGPPLRFVADVRVKGCGAVGVFRRGQLQFLCQGDGVAQRHALCLHDQDIFVLLASLSPLARMDATVKALQDALRLYDADVEYVAEEALLTLSDCAGAEGSLCVVGKAATRTSSSALPPISSIINEE